MQKGSLGLWWLFGAIVACCHGFGRQQCSSSAAREEWGPCDEETVTTVACKGNQLTDTILKKQLCHKPARINIERHVLESILYACSIQQMCGGSMDRRGVSVPAKLPSEALVHELICAKSNKEDQKTAGCSHHPCPVDIPWCASLLTASQDVASSI